MYFYYYPYYYANFYDYVGFVDGLTIHYPSNGNGYDSWIYRNYFDNVELSAAVADKATNKAIEALENVSSITTATNENKEFILESYNSYIVITDEAQQALLDETKVAHLICLYNQVIDLENPVVDNDTLTKVVGTFTGVDSDGTTYKFVINENGQGSIIVDNTTNDNQDRSFTFDKVRNSIDGKLLVITSEGTQFTFTINDDGTINFRYYVSDISLSKANTDTGDDDNNQDDPNKDPGDEPTPDPKPTSKLGLWIAIGASSVVVIGVIIFLVLFFIRKKKNI